jgi:hypothetical protein
MAYLGNRPAAGENNSFKILDDISSYTLTFNGSSASVVSLTDDTITSNNHRFITGQRVTYSTTGTAIGGLTSGTAYYIIKSDQNSVKLALTLSDANNNNAINFNALGTGTTHTLNVAFDGINTKFKATYDDGTKAAMSRAAQLTISINGVIQQPNDTTTPANGFGFDIDSVIIFSTPPVNTDVFWGHLVANNFPTFDISDFTVDNFTGNGSQIEFNLSKDAINNDNVLVTIDGVVQYPSDEFTTRAYSTGGNVLTFVSAPGNGTVIQVRHLGFAGANTSNVTGFYGRTGNVTLLNTDNVNVGSIEVGPGGINTTGAAVSMRDVVSSGIITASKFVGDGSLLTGVVSSKWRNNTAGITTQSSIGVNTTSVDVSALTGVGNSFQGIYVSNGMVIMDNTLNGNHYIGTNFNGLMAGPVNVNGSLTIDGVWVVV